MKKIYYQKVAFMGMLLIILFAFQKYTSKNKEDFSNVKFIAENATPMHLTAFDPNDLDEKQWQDLGFTEKQISTILNYKKIVGGKFISKEQFRKCYAVSGEKFSELESYILLPETNKDTKNNDYKSFPNSFNSEKAKIIYHNFDPNTLDFNGWKSFGFSDKQTQAILNYRDRILKGSFKNLEDIQKCFVISSEKFSELKPYIKLNPSTIAQNTDATKTKVIQEKTDFSKTDLNAITFKQLLEFGLDEKSAGMIIGFRKKLGGFVNKEQILTTYNIDKELVQKLLSIAPLNTSNVQKYTLIDAPEEWLKNHPYFKYSADKIIFYRLSEKDEKKIWKLLRTKPEYEARMKLYLK